MSLGHTQVNIGSGYRLVMWGNKPLPEPLLTVLCSIIKLPMEAQLKWTQILIVMTVQYKTTIVNK